MRYWYIVELKCELDGDKLGNPISAEIVDTVPRYTDGFCEWHDTEAKEHGIYTRLHWCRTKADAALVKKRWMKSTRT